MSEASTAPAQQSFARRSISALTRAPKIPSRKAVSAPAVKRIAVVLRRGMRPLEFRRIEDALADHNAMCLPLVVGQRRTSLADTPVCGLIVTGGDIDPTAAEIEVIEDAVREMRERGVPIMALTNAMTMVAEVAGVDLGAASDAHGVVLGESVRVLDGAHQLSAAVKQMAGRSERLP